RAAEAARKLATRPGGDGSRGRTVELVRSVYDRLSDTLGLQRLDPARLGEEEFWEKAENALVDIVEQMASAGAIPPSVDQDALIKDVLNEALGLGVLEDLLADTEVAQILVNRADQIYVDR